MIQTSTREQPGTVPVVIGTSYNAYGVVRSFADAGVRSILVSGRKRCFVQYSKYLEKRVALPEADADPEGFAAGLLELGKSLSPRRGMLFPTHDEQLIAIAKRADALSAYYEIPFSGWEACSRVIDKAGFRARCEALGVPTVRECLAGSFPEALQCLKTLRFPLIVKGNSVESDMGPAFPSGKMVFYGREGYESHMRRFFENVPGGALLVQEYIEGSAERIYSVNCVSDRDGEILALCVSQKIRNYPPQTGSSIAMRGLDAQSPAYQDIIRYTQALLKEFRIYGLSGTEYKYDAQDGRYKVIETNLRSEYFNYLHTLTGQNMPWYIYQYHLSGKKPAAFYPPVKSASAFIPFYDQFYAVHLNKIQYSAYAVTQKAWRESLSRPRTKYGLTARDLRPFLYSYAVSALHGLNAWFRVKAHISPAVRTIDYLRSLIKCTKTPPPPLSIMTMTLPARNPSTGLSARPEITICLFLPCPGIWMRPAPRRRTGA